MQHQQVSFTLTEPFDAKCFIYTSSFYPLHIFVSNHHLIVLFLYCFQLHTQQQWQQPDALSQHFSLMASARPLYRLILQWNGYGVQSSSTQGDLSCEIPYLMPSSAYFRSHCTSSSRSNNSFKKQNQGSDMYNFGCVWHCGGLLSIQLISCNKRL